MIKQTATALNLSSGNPAPSTRAPTQERRTRAGLHSLPLPAAANENALEVDVAARLAAEALAREKARERRERARLAERRRWLALLIAVLALLAGLKIYAAEVMKVLPGAAKIYQATGIQVPQPQLLIDALRVRWVPTPQGGHELAISGRVVNRTGQVVRFAPISMALLDAVGQPIYSWRIGKGSRTLRHGTQARFHTRLGAVPPQAASVRVRVAPERP